MIIVTDGKLVQKCLKLFPTEKYGNWTIFVTVMRERE